MSVRHVSIFANRRNQAIRIPREFEFKGVSEVEISKKGDCLIIRPSRPSWRSFWDLPKVNDDLLNERPDIFNEDRFMKNFEA